MPGKFEAPRNGAAGNRRRTRRRRRRFNPLFLVTLAALLAVIALCLTMCGKPDKETGEPEPATTDATARTEPSPTVVSTATLASLGDLLMHSYLFTSDARFPAASFVEKGVYNFDSVFQYVRPYIAQADLGAANLETTFGGSDIPYSGNPLFNCPDALADAVAKADFDILLTANNHCVDTGAAGIKRTLEQVRGRGLTALGTQMDETEKKYTVVDVNGIKLGLLCYTYAAGLESDGSPNFNLVKGGATVLKEDGLVNYFTEGNLEKLYAEVRTHLDNMRAEGAEAIVFFIHWGTEYALTENTTQRSIAQKLCDLGVDVIIGGHPHVVEPMDLLSSTTDPAHKTVCIYSLGNAVSNQRREEMQTQKSGHTEDGALFTVTFSKYSDGAVALTATDVIPTWVNKFTNSDGKVEYNILPLDPDTRADWQTLYKLSAEKAGELQSSYSRTMEIVGAGLGKCQAYLDASAPQPEAPAA